MNPPLKASRINSIPRTRKRVRDNPLPLLGVLQNPKLNHSKYAEGIAQTYAGSMIAASASGTSMSPA